MSSNGILMAFRAEALLGDADILLRIASLRNGLQYATEGNQVSFDDQLQKLREAVDGIPKLELETDVAPVPRTTIPSNLSRPWNKLWTPVSAWAADCPNSKDACEMLNGKSTI